MESAQTFSKYTKTLYTVQPTKPYFNVGVRNGNGNVVNEVVYELYVMCHPHVHPVYEIDGRGRNGGNGTKRNTIGHDFEAVYL